jgi:hypothetical protein
VLEPELAAYPLSPAKDPPTPLLTPALYVPALIPLRLRPPSVAVPEPLVVADPADAPLSVKLMLLPATPDPPEVSVAESETVPPNVPDAAATLSDVGWTVTNVKFMT